MSEILDDCLAQVRWNELDQHWEWRVFDPFHKIALDEGVSANVYHARSMSQDRLFQIQHTEWEPKVEEES